MCQTEVALKDLISPAPANRLLTRVPFSGSFFFFYILQFFSPPCVFLFSSFLFLLLFCFFCSSFFAVPDGLCWRHVTEINWGI